MLAHQLPTLPNMSIPSGRRRHRTRKTSTQYQIPAVLAAIILCAAGMVATIVSVAGGRSDDATRSGTRIVGEGLDLASLDTPVDVDRPIYRHSVVAGGVYTPDELRDVLVQDAIAATHYQGFNPNAVRAETVKQDRFAYVSYRKNDQIYWTRNKVKLSEGETVLTDGNKEIRARCGNCISETPQLPVAEVEPATAEFDQLVDPGDPFLSAAIRSALGSPAFGPTGRPGAAGGGSPAGRLQRIPVTLHLSPLGTPEAVEGFVLRASLHEVHLLADRRDRPGVAAANLASRLCRLEARQLVIQTPLRPICHQ